MSYKIMLILLQRTAVTKIFCFQVSYKSDISSGKIDR